MCIGSIGRQAENIILDRQTRLELAGALLFRYKYFIFKYNLDDLFLQHD